MKRLITFSLLSLLYACQSDTKTSVKKEDTSVLTKDTTLAKGHELIADSATFKTALADCQIRNLNFDDNKLVWTNTSVVDSSTGAALLSHSIERVRPFQNTHVQIRFRPVAGGPGNFGAEFKANSLCKGIWFNYGEFNGKATHFVLSIIYLDGSMPSTFILPVQANPPAGTFSSFGIKTEKQIKSVHFLLTDESVLLLDNLLF